MTKDNAKKILVYYANIPDMIKAHEEIKDYVEKKYYDGVKSPMLSGIPHGSGSGRPTETMGVRAAESGAGKRMDRNTVAIDVLGSDQEAIENALNSLCGKYKRILLWKYVSEYSWVKIATELEQPCSTVRNWHDKALYKLGENLEQDVMMVEELVNRANRAH